MLSLETILSLGVFALVSSMTPGPNNFMLLASGVNFGFRRTIPHMLGITLGFGFLLICVGAGLGALLTAFPSLYLALKILGGAYLIYLAYRIATSGGLGKVEGRERPMTFLEAATFQWVNPKAWTMALTAIALYSNPLEPYVSLVIVAGVFMILNFPSITMWTSFGMALRRFLADPVRLKVFNIVMGLLLVATVIPMMA